MPPLLPRITVKRDVVLLCGVSIAVLLGGCAQSPTTPLATTISVATTGKLKQIGFFTTLNADCSFDAFPTIKIAQSPTHGTASIETTSDFPNYPSGSQRFECSKKRTEGKSVKYLAAPGYSGEDLVALDIIWPTSTASQVLYRIKVGETAAEQGLTNPIVTRIVASGIDQRLDYQYSINPDCTPVGDIQIRKLLEPEHGSLQIEPSEIYTDFPKTNPRYDCNRKKTQGISIRYRSASGYMGRDSARVELLYPDQTIKQIVYEITVQ